MARKYKEHIIWEDIEPIKYEDWVDGYKEVLEINGKVPLEHPDEDDVLEWAYERREEYLYDERINLKRPISDNPDACQILMIADLGLWDGRHQGYKLVRARHISDILYVDADNAKWYGDGLDIRCDAYHHDGVNHILYRVVRPGVAIEKLTQRIYDGEEIDRKTLNRYTTSLYPQVAKVYGWE